MTSSKSTALSTASDSSLWSHYFDTRRKNDSMFYDEQSYIERLRRLSPQLFTSATDLEIIDSSTSADKPARVQLHDEASLSRQLEKVPTPVLRIISITQAFSLSPFNITESSMCQIFTQHHIPPGFLDILCGFGDKSASADEGAASGVCSSFDSTSHDIFYQFWYVEMNHRKHGDPWSVRQTGVYHRFSTKEVENLFLLLHPMPNSKAQTRLAVATESLDTNEMAFDPLRLHALIMSSYLDNWRWYLHDIKRRYIKLEDMLMTAELKDDSGLNFETLQDLRHLESKLIPVPTMLQSSISTLSSIRDMSKKLNVSAEANLAAETAYHLVSYASRLQSYVATAEVLQKRIENMTKFLADTLNIKNQEIAAKHQEIAADNQKIAADSNTALVKLTHDTVDDSSTVKTITFITLVYLPASFISGLFGMNLFRFDDSWAFDMSPQIWIYVVAVAILMFMTYAAWIVFARYQKRKKAPEEQAAQKSPV